jgi:hypothetical protein
MVSRQNPLPSGSCCSRVLRNKLQAVSQGARRFGTRSIFRRYVNIYKSRATPDHGLRRRLSIPCRAVAVVFWLPRSFGGLPMPLKRHSGEMAERGSRHSRPVGVTAAGPSRICTVFRYRHPLHEYARLFISPPALCQRSGLAHEHKRPPVKGVRVAIALFDHGHLL